MTPAEGIEGFRGGLLRCFDDALSLAREEGRREGVAAEREACAKSLEARAIGTWDERMGRSPWHQAARVIRERGKHGAG